MPPVLSVRFCPQVSRLVPSPCRILPFDHLCEWVRRSGILRSRGALPDRPFPPYCTGRSRAVQVGDGKTGRSIRYVGLRSKCMRGATVAAQSNDVPGYAGAIVRPIRPGEFRSRNGSSQCLVCDRIKAADPQNGGTLRLSQPARGEPRYELHPTPPPRRTMHGARPAFWRFDDPSLCP